MDMDKYVIYIDMPIEKRSIISEIKSLSRPTPATKKKNIPVSENEPLMLSSLDKKKGKKEKKKKKKQLLDGDFITSHDIISSDRDSELEGRVDSILSEDNLIDVDEILYGGEGEESIDDGIIDEQRRGYDRLKKEENPYKKEFAEELTLLYNLLDEINKFGKDIEKKFKSMESSKVRGISKYTNDLIMSIISTKTSKLNVLKEISNIKKTIADLKLKMDAKSKASEGAVAGAKQLASAYFQEALKYGRNRFVREFSSGEKDEDAIDDLVEEFEARRSSYSPLEMEDIQRAIEERLETEENSFRSDAGSKYIEYENRGVKIYIEKVVDTGEWNFVALDRNMQRIDDYPLPRKRDVGKVKFSDDGRHATDERGRTFKVIEVFSPDED